MDRMTAADLRKAQDFPSTIDEAGIATPSYTEALVAPGSVFRDPAQVVGHPCFTREEKRTILLSWARDELVLEQVANRTLPELKPRSRIDPVIEALCKFDASAAAEYGTAVAAIRAQYRRWAGRHSAPFKARRA
jgi:hypothetical protein